jgi:hypothetical protein
MRLQAAAFLIRPVVQGLMTLRQGGIELVEQRSFNESDGTPNHRHFRDRLAQCAQLDFDFHPEGQIPDPKRASIRL